MKSKQRIMKNKQRGFLLNPYRFGSAAAADPFFANVVLLMHCNGVDGSTTITDNSAFARTLTVSGNAQISTAQQLLGGASALFDGTGDFISSPSAANLNLPADFTIEVGVRYNTGVSGQFLLNRKTLTAAPAANDWGVNITTATGGFSFEDSSGHIFTFASGNLAADTWYQLAIVRSSGVVWGYKNGEKSTNSFSIATDFSNTRTLEIGRWDFVPNCMKGNLDEIRITTAARYTASYTPDFIEFPNF